ncbi:hypothetical protein Tco_0918226, partial [Tanacetum coccineum]
VQSKVHGREFGLRLGKGSKEARDTRTNKFIAGQCWQGHVAIYLRLIA